MTTPYGGYDPLNLDDPNHPLASLGAAFAKARQREAAESMQRQSLAAQLMQGMPAPQTVPARYSAMMPRPQPQGPNLGQSILAGFNSASRRSYPWQAGTGASVSAAVELGDPNKPPPAQEPGLFGRAWEGLFGGYFGGGAKGPG